MITFGLESQPAFVFERSNTIVAQARRARALYLGQLVGKAVRTVAGLFKTPTEADRLWHLSSHTLRDIGIEEATPRDFTFGAQVPFQVANENQPRYVA